MSKGRTYQISILKLIKIKKYLGKNFKKRFISLNITFYVSSIYFVAKSNDKLRFYMNYRKINTIIIRNFYLISFIKEIFVRVMNHKYLTKLNIIIVFNKLHMHLNSENLIIFIIFIKVYKYYNLSFNLMNKSINY